MTREDKILLLSSHISLDPGRQQVLREAVTTGLDWDCILKISREEQTCCLMYHHFKSLDLERFIPDAVRQVLKSLYYEVCARNTLIISRTRQLLEVLDKEHLPIILLKGIFLARCVYPVIGSRPMADIDILVQGKDRSRLVDILREFGYDFIGKKNWENNPLEYALTFEVRDKTRLPLSIDVHSNILTATWLMGLCGSKVDLEAIWSKAEPLQFEGTRALGLSPEHLLIFLSSHSFTHDYERLLMLVDIEGVLQMFKGRLDLEHARNEAQQFGLDNILEDALERVRRLAERDALGEEFLFKKLHPGFSSLRYVITRPGLFERIRCLIFLGILYLRIKIAKAPFFRR
jgi:hypothetical protein